MADNSRVRGAVAIVDVSARRDLKSLSYLARQNPLVVEQLWQRFLEANPRDQEYWRIGLGNGYYPKELSARMESTIHDWLQSTDPSKESLRDQWRGFYTYRDKNF